MWKRGALKVPKRVKRDFRVKTATFRAEMAPFGVKTAGFGVGGVIGGITAPYGTGVRG